MRQQSTANYQKKLIAHLDKVKTNITLLQSRYHNNEQLKQVRIGLDKEVDKLSYFLCSIHEIFNVYIFLPFHLLLFLLKLKCFDCLYFYQIFF
jgi:hypothetical protein